MKMRLQETRSQHLNSKMTTEVNLDFVDGELEALQLEYLDWYDAAYVAECADWGNEASEGFPDDAARMCQAEFAGFSVMRSKGRRPEKGSGKGFKGKMRGGRFGIKRTSKTLEERKKRLRQLKKRTKCSSCGERGHLGRKPTV